MASLNYTPRFRETTHQGAPAARMNSAQALRRSVLNCLLWEKEFYEDGEEIAARIAWLAAERPSTEVAELAVAAREKFQLRHAPLVLLSVLAKTAAGGPLLGITIPRVIQRADELTEFLAVHAKLNGVTPDKVRSKISKQMKLGLARAFRNFDEYQLAKYDRAGAIRLRDVLFLTHPKPIDEAQQTLWNRLVANSLTPPDTWEVALSAGADKKETFERLLREGRLGYLALLRNLRGMLEAAVDEQLIRDALLARKGAERVLPFRYVAAARAAPRLEAAIDAALTESINGMPKLTGRTVVLVDVSGSMLDPLSKRSDLSRMDAAAALASIIPGELRVFSFSNSLVELPPRKGMAGVDAIVKSQPHAGTLLGAAIGHISMSIPHDRLIVITDEQSHDPVMAPAPGARGYMINVASARNGVGYGGRWVHIDGFSEAVLKFIHEHEASEA